MVQMAASNLHMVDLMQQHMQQQQAFFEKMKAQVHRNDQILDERRANAKSVKLRQLMHDDLLQRRYPKKNHSSTRIKIEHIDSQEKQNNESGLAEECDDRIQGSKKKRKQKKNLQNLLRVTQFSKN